jgi:AmmeMemoRadiSam system protein A
VSWARGERRAAARRFASASASSASREPLTVDERDRLREFARERIRAAVLRLPCPAFGEPSRGLARRCGVFVTLTNRGNLRGCIGMTTGEGPIWESVGEMAVSAALRDPRFPPVAAGELPDLEVEISILSPAVPVGSIERIRIGRDGVLLRRGAAAGFFLPKVASERGWDRVRLLENLAVKAGLEPNDWREGDLFVFEAEVF